MATIQASFANAAEFFNSLQLSIQVISTRTGFVAKAYLPVALAKFLRQLDDLTGAIGDDPQVLPTSPPRIPSATATEIVALCTSSPTKMLSFIRPAPHA